MAEERDANNNVTKRFFTGGEQISGNSYYFTSRAASIVLESS
jgi:hypothetical protein